MKKRLLVLLIVPLFISCQEKYNKPPYDDKEMAFRKFEVEKAKSMVLDSLWDKRDSLTYIRLKNLEVMMISESSTIPHWIGNFKMLKIFISTNEKRKIQDIPPSIDGLINLKQLDLPNNNIHYLPSSLYQLKNLNYLSLSNNPIDSLSPQIRNLQNLKHLYLEGTNINLLPREICNLNQLEAFMLEDTPLKELPLCLGTLPHLEQIDVSGTRLSEFPIEILHAPKLETIYAKRLKLKNYQEIKNISKEIGVNFYYDE